MRVFGLKSCDTTRAAMTALRKAGFAPVLIDVRDEGVAPADLDTMLKVLGEKIVNRQSTTWRELSEEERQTDPALLLVAHPTVMKRPVIDSDGVWTMGWTAEVQKAVLGQV